MSKYAGFWKRVAALIIDSILVQIAVVVLGFTLGMLVGMLAGEEEIRAILWTILSILLPWIYFAVMESSVKQSTLGKMLLGVKVTDIEGHKISFGRATGRYFGKFISALILGIGFLMAAFSSKKQGLHDMLASTLVVNNEMI